MMTNSKYVAIWSLLILLIACNRESDPIYVLLPNNVDTIIGGIDTTGTDTTTGDDTTSYLSPCDAAIIDPWIFTFDIRMAKYVDASNRILVLSETSYEVYLVDPVAETQSMLALPKRGLCMDVTTDGKLAAVGHDGLITLIDLESFAIKKSMPVSCKAHDIVLASNGWVYAFPAETYDARCINIDTEVEILSEHYSIGDGHRAEKHPTQNAIYVARDGVSPDDPLKLSIEEDTAIFLYDAPGHGNHSYGNELWMNESGTHVFFNQGPVLRTTSSTSTDLTYSGTLESPENENSWSTVFLHICDSKEANKVVAIHADYDHSEFIPDSSLFVFDGTYFERIDVVSIPRLKVEGYCRKLLPRFGFFNSAGTEYYLIGKINDEYNKVKWTLIPLEI